MSSVLYKKKNDQNYIKAECLRKLVKLDVKDKSIIDSAIKKYMKNQEFPYTFVEAKLFLKSELNSNISFVLIRKILKRSFIIRLKDFHPNQ